MTSDERFPDDPVLRRVADARPAMREEDLSPTGERASTIADRVIQTTRGHTPDPRPAPRRRSRHRGPIALGALATVAAAAVLCIVLLSPARHHGTSNHRSRVAADVVHIDITASKLTLSQRFALARTPLGAEIARQFEAIQENIETGSVAQNERVIRQLMANEAACEAAATAVQSVRATPGQRAFQRYWVLGTRLQASSDRQLIIGLQDVDDGRRDAGQRALAASGDLADRDDLLTAWAEQRLMGESDPFPRIALKPRP